MMPSSQRKTPPGLFGERRFLRSSYNPTLRKSVCQSVHQAAHPVYCVRQTFASLVRGRHPQGRDRHAAIDNLKIV